MRLSILYLIGLIVCGWMPLFAQTNEDELPTGDSFLFSFMPGEADIQASYGNNAIEIERLNQPVDRRRIPHPNRVARLFRDRLHLENSHQHRRLARKHGA